MACRPNISPGLRRPNHRGVGRSRGVGRGLGVTLGVAVGVAVGLTLGVGDGDGVGVGVGCDWHHGIRMSLAIVNTCADNYAVLADSKRR